MLEKDRLNVDAPFVLKGVSYLLELRRESEYILGDYLERLVKESKKDSPEFFQEQTNVEYHDEPQPKTSFFDSLKKGFKFVSLLFKYTQQIKTLSSIDQKMSKILVLAIASNRLIKDTSNANIKLQLIKLAKDFSPNSEQLGFDSDIIHSNLIFIVDPASISPLWSKYKECKKENMIIVDDYFIYFLVVLGLFKFRFKHILNCLKNRNLILSSFKKELQVKELVKISLGTGLFLEGYQSLFRDANTIKTLFFTSNSFATEVLRLFLIQYVQTKSIVEIMHGVPTVFYANYLKGIIDLGETMNHSAKLKHSSVAQIPDLPMFSILLEDVKCSIKSAVHTYLNDYMNTKSTQYGSFVSFVNQEVKDFYLDKEKDAYVVSFSGAATHVRCPFNSDTFKLECFIMKKIKTILTEQKKQFMIIYTPHPAYDFEQFSNQPFFEKENIILHPETIFTWFISDLSMALYSGSVYESVFFGAKAFLPMYEKELIYPEVLLNLLTYPRDETYLASLLKFLTDHTQTATQDPNMKVEQRLSLALKGTALTQA